MHYVDYVGIVLVETGNKLKTTLRAQYATFYVLCFKICTLTSCYIIHAVSLFLAASSAEASGM